MVKRHDLLWLTADGWQAAFDAHPGHAPVFQFWRREAWPVAARRHDSGANAGAEADAGGSLCVGLTLPPDSGGKRLRIGWRVTPQQIARSSAPLTLKEARPALPPHWRAGYTTLQRLAVGLDIRVFGALAWQALTSLREVTDDSCIDILLRPVNRHQLQAGLALLSGPEHGLPLDGEIMFPNGDAVSWRAWLASAGARERVLVKNIGGSALADPDALLATLKPG